MAAFAACAATLLALDFTFLGVVMKGAYEHLLGPLKAEHAFVPAAALFYLLYLTAVVAYAVVGATGLSHAGRRGAALGLIAYGTYELTNWAVLRDWPMALVPIDLTWGVVLTAVTALVGRATYARLLR